MSSAPAPVPFWIARSMLSLGIEASRAFCTARASAGFPSMSPPPSRAATVIARASFVNCWPRRASTTAFLCLIECHFECPDIGIESKVLREPQREDGARAWRTGRLDAPAHRQREFLDDRQAEPRPYGTLGAVAIVQVEALERVWDVARG